MPLVLLLIGILPLKNHPLWTESGGDYTTSKYLGAICLIYALVYVFMHGRKPRYLDTSQARWYLLFFLTVFVSFLRIRNLAAAYNPILGPISLLMLWIVLLSVVDSLQRLRLVLLATIASVGWASLYVIREWVKTSGWATGNSGEWVVGDRNHFAVSAICAVSLAWYLSQALRPGWEKWLCQICALLALAALVIGGSRGGLLGLLTALLFGAYHSRKRVRNIVAVLVIVIGFNLGYPRSPLRRLLEPSVSDQGSTLAHEASWRAGLGMVGAHPLAGVGVGMFRSQMLRYAPAWYVDDKPYMAHDAYISLAAELGIPGLAVFLIVLGSTYRSLGRIHRMRSAPRLITQTSVALQAALLGSCVGITSISGEHHEYLWLIIFESMCLSSLVRCLPAVRQTQSAELASNRPVVLAQV